ncbi:ribonuclease E/G [Actinobaculum sp. 313]|nr:ribonuclease E/G [Actinobaculum sp. 313]
MADKATTSDDIARVGDENVEETSAKENTAARAATTKKKTATGTRKKVGRASASESVPDAGSPEEPGAETNATPKTRSTARKSTARIRSARTPRVTEDQDTGENPVDAAAQVYEREEGGEPGARGAAKKSTRARARKKAAGDVVSEDASSAVAASLAALEERAPARTSRAAKVAGEPLADFGIDLDAIPPRGSSKRKSASAAEHARTPDGAADTDAVVSSGPTDSGVEPVGMTALLFQEPDTSSLFREPETRISRRRGSSRSNTAASTTDDDSVTPATRKRTRGSRSAASADKTDNHTRRGNEKDVITEESSAHSSPSVGSTDSAPTPAEAASATREARRRRRGTRGRRRTEETNEEKRTTEATNAAAEQTEADDADSTTTRRRRRRRANGENGDEVTALKGSTRLEAKRQRRKEGREAGRRRHVITESEYLARRESVKREMLVREQDGLNQIAVLEDDILVEHYVARHTQVSMVGNVYLGRIQNVLPSMEAAFVDIGKGRNAVLYAGEVNWEAAGMEGKPRRIEQALKSGDTVMVQVTKDPIGHKGARLTAQITLAGRHLVLVPSGAMTGISRKLPDKERHRLKRLLRQIVPEEHGVIVRTAAEGATEEQLRADVERLTKTWEDIQAKAKNTKAAPMLLKGEPELAVRVVRDIFNEDFAALKVQGRDAWQTISDYVGELSPELVDRLQHWTSPDDIFAEHRVDEQLAKAFDRKVWLPSGGTLVIDRTEAMTVIDVNTGKFTGSGGTLEETVTRNNLEAAEEIVRQLRLRDIGGIIVIDFIDMVLESNRELVLRRLVECLGRDRTRHQVAEVTSLGLVQMTRKRVGQGLVEAFSTTCEACEGRGFITHTHPVEQPAGLRDGGFARRKTRGRVEQRAVGAGARTSGTPDEKHSDVKAALNSIAAAASHHREAEAKEEDAGTASVPPSASSAVKKDSAPEAESSKSEAQEAPPQEQATKAADAGEVQPQPSEPKSTARKKSKTHRVSSAGTITPGAGTAAILSFPAK